MAIKQVIMEIRLYVLIESVSVSNTRSFRGIKLIVA